MHAGAGSIEVVGGMEEMGVGGEKRREEQSWHWNFKLEALVLSLPFHSPKWINPLKIFICYPMMVLEFPVR